MKIAFFDSKQYDINSFQDNNESEHNLKFFEYKLNEETAYLAKGYDVVCIFVNDIINKEVIDILHDLGVRLIALRCAGYNNVDFKSAFGKIHVVRVPAYSPYAVAEHAAALMISLNRKTHKAYVRTRDNNFSINGLIGFDMKGKTVGVIGTGRIGRIFIDICNGFGMNVLAFDMHTDERVKATYCSLEEIYEKSDIISLHCPLTSGTHHMINTDSIKSMKDGVMILNTSRGGLINAESLIEGLKSKKIGFAGLDVYEEEAEYFFEDFSEEIIGDDILARLLSFPNVLITSHQAFFTKEALYNIANTTYENISAFEKNEFLKNEICYDCTKSKESCNKNTKGKCF